MANPIVVTGATGNVGAENVKILVEQGYAVRLADFDLDRIHKRFGEGIEAVRFEFGDPST